MKTKIRLKGLVTIEDIGQQEVTENIYQNDTLKRVPFNIPNMPEEKISSAILWDKQNLFTDSALEAEGLSREAK